MTLPNVLFVFPRRIFARCPPSHGRWGHGETCCSSRKSTTGSGASGGMAIDHRLKSSESRLSNAKSA